MLFRYILLLSFDLRFSLGWGFGLLALVIVKSPESLLDMAIHLGFRFGI